MTKTFIPLRYIVFLVNQSVPKTLERITDQTLSCLVILLFHNIALHLVTEVLLNL